MRKEPRVFVEKESIDFPDIIISGTDVNYILNVLRLKKEDKIIILDGSNKEYLAKIEYVSKDKINCKILNENIIEDKIDVDITLAQAIPKGRKMDFIVEKATELGVTRIIPVNTERTIPKINQDKIIRWNRIAKESSEQCGRSKLPLIDEITDFEEVLKEIKNYDLAIMPWELEAQVHIKDILKNNTSGRGSRRGNEDLSELSRRDKKKIFVIIGAEGGFSLTEVSKAKDNGVVTVSLGKLILRVETASLTTLSIINYEFSVFLRYDFKA